MTIGYIDFEFTREANGQLRPTELGIAWWQNQYLKCQLGCFSRNHKLKQVRQRIRDIMSSLYENGHINTLVFWDKTQDKQILNDCGVNLKLYTIIDLQDELGKTALDKTAKTFNINSDTLQQYILPTQRNEVKKLSAHSGIGDALRIALIHKHLLTETTTTTVTTTTQTKTKTKTKVVSSYAQIFQYLDTIDFNFILLKKRLTDRVTMILWKDVCLKLPHLEISYHNFKSILQAHLLSLL